MTDEQIIDLYWRRDEAAISQTAAKYGPYCYAIAYSILSTAQDSEECVNDTYLRAWESMPPQRPGRLQMFLAKITRNLAFDRFKAQRAKKRGGGEMRAVLEELSGCIASGSSPEQQLLGRELENAVAKFVRELPKQEGNIFARRYFYVESIDQIAQRYDMSANTVRVRLSRMRRSLSRQSLQGEVCTGARLSPLSCGYPPHS